MRAVSGAGCCGSVRGEKRVVLRGTQEAHGESPLSLLSLALSAMECRSAGGRSAHAVCVSVQRNNAVSPWLNLSRAVRPVACGSLSLLQSPAQVEACCAAAAAADCRCASRWVAVPRSPGRCDAVRDNLLHRCRHTGGRGGTVAAPARVALSGFSLRWSLRIVSIESKRAVNNAEHGRTTERQQPTTQQTPRRTATGVTTTVTLPAAPLLLPPRFVLPPPHDSAAIDPRAPAALGTQWHNHCGQVSAVLR